MSSGRAPTRPWPPGAGSPGAGAPGQQESSYLHYSSPNEPYQHSTYPPTQLGYTSQYDPAQYDGPLYAHQPAFVQSPAGYYPAAAHPSQMQPCQPSQSEIHGQWYNQPQPFQDKHHHHHHHHHRHVHHQPQPQPQPVYNYNHPHDYDYLTAQALPGPSGAPQLAHIPQLAAQGSLARRLSITTGAPTSLNLPQLTRQASQIYPESSTPNKRSRPSSAVSTLSAFAAFLPSAPFASASASTSASTSSAQATPDQPHPLPDQLVPRLQALSRARRSAGPGLPEVKPARESSGGSPSLQGGELGPSSRLNTNKPRTTFDLSAMCSVCAQRGVKLIIRGQAIARADFCPTARFTCTRCLGSLAVPVAAPSKPPSPSEERSLAQFPSYSETLSAAIDRLEGITLADPPCTESEVEVEVPETGPDGASRFKCDCCMRPVGLGLVVDQVDPAASFTAEIVCTHCQDLYRLCSDCGGGGGRLTIGRWRCKELFPLGRKTCRLSHARNPRLNELQWSVYKITDIPAELFSYIREGCKTVYFGSRLQTTARPEALEYGVALSRTFAQAEQLTIDSWNLLTLLLTDDVERSRGLRRYVSFHAAIPSSRRGKSKAKTMTGNEANPIITGFLFAEWDLRTGAVHFSAAFPWALTGDSFDAMTRTGEEVVAQIRADLGAENAARTAAGQACLPELKCVWLLSPFSKDSKAFVSLRTRGYVSVDELRQGADWLGWEDSLVQVGGVFPPQRECHIPEPFTRLYQIAVRVLEGPDDLGAPPTRRRPRKAASQEANDAPAPPSRRK